MSGRAGTALRAVPRRTVAPGRGLPRPGPLAVVLLCATLALVAPGVPAKFTGTTSSAASLGLAYFAFDSATITTWAGTGVGGYSGDGGAATAAKIYQPSQAAVDTSGNLYLADLQNNRIRKITAAGTISTFAGNGTAGFSGDGGQATSAMLNNPRGVALDSAGNLYIADSANNRIRKVSTSGVITTVAGTGTASFSGDGGAATSATLNLPRGLAVDSADRLYVVDSLNYRVRRISAGTITTVAGTGTAGYAGDGGAATSAQINQGYDIAANASDCLYLADADNDRVRYFCPGGSISTVAGTGVAGYGGDGGAATSAQLNGPSGVTVDANGVLYIADRYNHRLRKVTPFGKITTLAGNGTAATTGDGGAATSASVDNPRSVAFYGSYLYLVEQDGQVIRRLS